MKYQKSPFPYIVILIAIITVAVYSNILTNQQARKPIHETVGYQNNTQLPKMLANNKNFKTK